MSVARGNGQNGGHFYSNVTQPVKLYLNFIVDADNSNGLGLRSLKSNGYARNVFMHTSTTPGSNNGALNPNPAAGFALIQLNSNYRYCLGMSMAIQSPLSGSPLTATAANVSYVITALGTATLAQWQAKGLPPGLTPAVGMSFVATATGTIGGSAAVQVPIASGVQSMEIVGNPSAELGNSNIAANGGAYLLIKFMGPTNSSTTTPIPVAPAEESVISLCIDLDISSVTIDGL